MRNTHGTTGEYFATGRREDSKSPQQSDAERRALPTGTGRKERGVVGLSRPDSLDATLAVRRLGVGYCAASWVRDGQRLRHDVNTCSKDTETSPGLFFCLTMKVGARGNGGWGGGGVTFSFAGC